MNQPARRKIGPGRNKHESNTATNLSISCGKLFILSSQPHDVSIGTQPRPQLPTGNRKPRPGGQPDGSSHMGALEWMGDRAEYSPGGTFSSSHICSSRARRHGFKDVGVFF